MAEADTIELTILMPCLDEAETLARCIVKARAYLARSGVSGEVLIADNGSTDGSQAIARAHGARVVAIAARVAACTMLWLPSKRLQVMVVVPSGPVATCGLSAFWSVVERLIGVLKVVAFAARVAACTMSLMPSKRL